jgi:hypothetical protein
MNECDKQLEGEIWFCSRFLKFQLMVTGFTALGLRQNIMVLRVVGEEEAHLEGARK